MDAKAAEAQDGAAGALLAGPGSPGPAGLLRALGPGRILALGAVAAALLGFFAFVIWRASAPDYTLLFAGLELADSQQLVRRLEEAGVPHRLSDAGDAIMVPAGDALRLRMSLAEEGLPLGGAVGYELLDQAGPFGTSEFLANVNLRRAIEGELARSISTLRQVRSARVHIVQPKRELFAREAAAVPSASIVLALRGGGELDKRQVAGIKHLVAAAVPGLSPERVTLVDDRGTLLAQAEAGDGSAVSAGEADDQRVALENRLRARIVQLLERSVGAGRVDAAVSADMDFDEVATTAETFDPNGQVVRSTQTNEEDSNAAERQPEDPVTVANNLPTERAAQQGAGEATSSERAKRTEETVNYEISRTVRNQTRRGGVVRRLSIAVQVDGTYRQGADGTLAYEPRPAEELEQLESLVRGAAGVDEERGDVVEVVARRFVQSEAGVSEDSPTLLGLGREDYWRVAELATLAALTLLVLFLGVRPALRRIFPERQAPAPVLAEPAAAVLDAEGKPLLGYGGADAGLGLDAAGPVSAPAEGSMLELRNVRGQVRASLVHDVAQIIDGRSEEAVRVIRGWLHEG